MKKPLLLVVLDGFGIAKKSKGNAISLSSTPNLTNLFSHYPYTVLQASEQYVGLLPGQMGNSEVGHMNMGAGRVVEQDLTLINSAINKGSFNHNKILINAINHAKLFGGDLHLLGLCSDGGVHSDINHLFALLKLAKDEKFDRVFIHFISDGRDTPMQSAISYAKLLEENISKIGVGKVATLCGRYYAMDREKNFDRTKLYYDAIVNAKANNFGTSLVEAIQNNYDNGINDEFILPTVLLDEKGQPVGHIKDNDAVLFFDFRADRMRQIVSSIGESSFNKFKTKNILDLQLYSFTCYDEKFANVKVAFINKNITNTLSEVISRASLTQFKISETTKYAHVTYFFNGGVEKPFDNEDRLIIDGGVVEKFDEYPKMKSEEITNALIEKLDSKKYDFLLVNYPNCDMVGHTGNIKASITAIEQLDRCVGRLHQKIKELNGIMIITADHGNVDKMLYDSGEVCTTHSTNPVPFCIVGDKCNFSLKKGALCNIAPTVCELMKLRTPKEFQCESLIEK